MFKTGRTDAAVQLTADEQIRRSPQVETEGRQRPTQALGGTEARMLYLSRPSERNRHTSRSVLSCAPLSYKGVG